MLYMLSMTTKLCASTFLIFVASCCGGCGEECANGKISDLGSLFCSGDSGISVSDIDLAINQVSLLMGDLGHRREAILEAAPNLVIRAQRERCQRGGTGSYDPHDDSICLTIASECIAMTSLVHELVHWAQLACGMSVDESAEHGAMYFYAVDSVQAKVNVYLLHHADSCRDELRKIDD